MSAKTRAPPPQLVAGWDVPGWTSLPGRAQTGLIVGLAAVTIGTGVYVAARAAGIVRLPIIYQALVFGTFFGAYMSMPGGFERNFNVPVLPTKKMTIADVVYYTTVVHTTAGFGDIYPTTFYARCVVAAHLGSVFLALAGLVPFLSSG